MKSLRYLDAERTLNQICGTNENIIRFAMSQALHIHMVVVLAHPLEWNNV